MLNRLTGVRAVAAILVVFYHFGDSFSLLFPAFGLFRPIYKSGDMGVDLFFILSGFILSLNYLDGFRVISAYSYSKFLRARLARIYPVHLFTLLLLTAFVLLARGASVNLNTAHYSGFTWVTNALLVDMWPGFNRGLSWNFPSWSISCEWFAYLLFPLFAFRIGSTKRPYIWFTLCLLLYAVPCFYGIEVHPTRWSMLRIVSEFFAGCFLFQIQRLGWKCPLPAWISGLASVSICAVGTYLGTNRALSLPFFALLIWALADNSEGWLAGSVAVYWGQVSYSLYMTNGLCEIFLNRALPAANFVSASPLIRSGIVAAYLFVVGLAAVLAFHYVETPARRWLNRSEKRTILSPKTPPIPVFRETPSGEAQPCSTES
jgi:peptidoglycan/LPS O-acetylase OafA/YrhL